ncbi:hypothetical protein LQ424_29215 [Rhodococcus qingshengii]|uniref:hypothetical protein n=1 Tax=Rhodococcus qingshengii TaxID=334542 RepID=UPI001E37537D|nr:hypothetical protein [Rhodococcus qingshengii]MCD2135906.1 hypothetical protein [Rhodococcus qingshengii]
MNRVTPGAAGSVLAVTYMAPTEGRPVAVTDAPTTGTGKTVSVGAAAAGCAPKSSATPMPATIDVRRKP